MLTEKEEQHGDHQQERQEGEQSVFEIIRRAIVGGLALNQSLEIVGQNRNRNGDRERRRFERLAAGIDGSHHVGDHFATADHHCFAAVGLGKDAQRVFEIVHLDFTKRLGLAQLGDRNGLHRITAGLGSADRKRFHANVLTKNLLNLLALKVEVEHHAEVGSLFDRLLGHLQCGRFPAGDRRIVGGVGGHDLERTLGIVGDDAALIPGLSKLRVAQSARGLRHVRTEQGQTKNRGGAQREDEETPIETVGIA